MLIKRVKVCKGRYFLRGERLSHIIWDNYNSNNPWKKGYVVHHKDGDKLNDHISNLELLLNGQHSSLHGKTRPVTKEFREKLRLANLGKHHSEESKRKISLVQKGKIVSEETKEKCRLSNIGQKRTNETKEKMRLAQLGKHLSEETKRKISLKNKGRKHSEETKRKMSNTKRLKRRA